MKKYINVPFHEKEEAKKLGAKWDLQEKSWYIPDGISHSLFYKWIYHPNIKSDYFFLAQTNKYCWKCEKEIPVYAFLLPPNHENLEQIDEEDAGFGENDIFTNSEFERWDNSQESKYWQTNASYRFVSYITDLPDNIFKNINSLSKNYFKDFSKTTQISYYLNHCNQCGAKQGDFELFNEFDSPFAPMYKATAEKILLQKIDVCFECSGDLSSDVEIEFIDVMKSI